MSDSSVRIELAIRAALLAKAVLEIVNLNPSLVPLQLEDVSRQVLELKVAAAKAGAK